MLPFCSYLINLFKFTLFKFLHFCIHISISLLCQKKKIKMQKVVNKTLFEVLKVAIQETDLGENESVLGKRNSQGLTRGKIHEAVL